MAIEEKQYLDPDGLKEVINQTDARYATKDLATTSTSGLMSSSDKTKLNNIESGANKTVIDSALSSTSTNPVQNKLINAVLIEIDSAIDEITENVSNLDTNKVDKVSGKGLSTEDYTTAEKEKLAGIEEGANKTVVDSAWSATSENPLQNKVIYGMFDQLVSEFGDEISKLQEADANKANTSDLTAHTTDSTIHFTAAERTKLAGIATGANKTTIDSSMSTTSTNPVQNKVVQSAIQTLEDTKANVDELPKAFYVTITEESDNTYSADKTFAEIVEAYKNGKSVFCIHNDVIIPLVQLSEEFILFTFSLCLGGGSGIIVTMAANGDISCSIEGMITGAATTIASSNLTAARALVSNSSGKVAVSAVTSTELGYLDGVTSNVQSQFTTITDELSDHTSNSDIHFTAAERTKLAGVATGANKYTHPTSGVTAGTYKSVTVDTQGHVTSGTNPTTLAGYGITDAEAKGSVNTHNSSSTAHSDIRLLISNLTTQVTNFLDVDDTTKDQLSEVIALIEANADSIESITSGKVNVSDIINNLTTNVSNKPLSAAQGVVIKELIDDLQSALDTHTHNYAGSSSVGGAATSANKLNTNAGDSNTPVYFANGVPVACTSLDLNTTGNAETATKATQDSTGQQIDTTYIKSLSASGKNLTYTKGNGTTATIDTQQNFITLTKAEYDALVSAGTVNEDCYYFITDDANTSPVLIQYITFAASGWTASDDGTYYTQSATATQITADDEPMVVKNLPYSTAASTAKAYNKAFGILTSGVGETADGVVNWKCYKKPATDITVGLIKVMA